ncbi:RNA-binding (RRM/RBD/RNP motifs) family protein [Wolffia australiana]
MTIDDEKSVYVGGLPYDATEETVRRAFDLYGAVRDIRIINDRLVGGKCYGFVTFTNPRSAIDAINDMNGRTIGGRVVRVNEVRTRGRRPNFSRDGYQRFDERDVDWDRGRERDRDRSHERDRYRDRDVERSRDHDREHEREYDDGYEAERNRDRMLDPDREHEDHEREHSPERDQDWDRSQDADWDHEREMDRTEDYERSKEKDNGRHVRNRFGSSNDRQNREMSSNSNAEYLDHVKEQLDVSIRRREELQKLISHMEEKVEDKSQLVSDLQKKFQKLEEALALARKLSSQRQSQLSKLQRCFLQVQDYSEKLKSSELELQAIVDTVSAELDGGEDQGVRDGTAYGNVTV